MVRELKPGPTGIPAIGTAGPAHRVRSALLAGTALQAVTALLLSFPARSQPAPTAHPVGGVVSAGDATVSFAPGTTTITQTSQRAAVNWQSFNVGAQQAVNFRQPSSSSSTLNRVTSPNPSEIAGKINADGQVVLLNRSGVVFAKGAQVNTAGLIVSAAGTSDANFMAGKTVFDQPAKPNAAIVNRGTLTVSQAGLAGLVAPQVRNAGVITAKLGHVVLAGAKTATLDLYGDGLVSLGVNDAVTQAPVRRDGKPVTALVTNTGVIQASGGTVQLTAREADGVVQNLVEAGGTITAPSVGAQQGRIVLGGVGGSVVLSGLVAADGTAPGTTGGSVEVNADAGVTLTSTARVRASGQAGGGTVAIGTTLARARGGPGTPAALTAKSVMIAPGARIAANANVKGNGGRVTVLAGQTTDMAGSIDAKGGAQGGDGGFVEVSGNVLSLTGMVDTSAPNGATGTLLLDPTDLWISDTKPTGTTAFPTAIASNGGFTNTGNTDPESWISTSTLNVLANGTNIELSAANNINIASTDPTSEQGIKTPNTLTLGTSTLSLDAANNLTIDRGFTISASGITLSAGSGSITLDGSSGLGVTGSVGGLIDAGTLAGLRPTSLQSQGGSVTMTAANGDINLADSTLEINAAPIGTLNISAGGAVSESADATLITGDLEGEATSFSLLSTNNRITSIGNTDNGRLIATAGDIVVVDGTNLTLQGTETGRHLFYEVAQAGGTLTTGAFLMASGNSPSASEAASSDARISLVADTISTAGSNVTNPPPNLPGSSNGSIELAPFSAIQVVVNGAGTGSGTLALTSALLQTFQADTMVIGGFTDVPHGATSPTASASSIAIDGALNLSGSATTTLSLLSRRLITQQADAPIAVATLTGSASGASLDGAGNAIGTLGTFNVSNGDFALSDTGPLSIAGSVSAPSLVTIGGTDPIAPATLTAPNSITVTGGGSIRGSELFLASGNGGIALNTGASLLDQGQGTTLNSTGAVIEAPGATVSATNLVGGATSFDLVSPSNAIDTIAGFGNTLVATGGDIEIVGAVNPTLAGTISGRNLFIEVTTPGGTLSLGTTGERAIPAKLTVSTGGRISLVADGITETVGSTITAPGGSVELAPLSPINTSVLGANGLLLDSTILGSISTDTLVVGGFTNAPQGATARAASARSVSVDAPFDLAGIATSLDLLATSTVTQPGGPITNVGTLSAAGPTVTLNNTGNTIASLGNVSAGNFTLDDNATLTVAGNAAAQAISITYLDSPTMSGSTAVAGGIDLASGASLGQPGATITLTSAGGITEAPGATITAATLTGSSDGPASLNGTANAIATLGSFTASGSNFELSDTGSLSIDGPVTATGAVLIGGAAGSTPDSVAVVGGGSVVSEQITLASGGGGITVDGGAMLGQPGATIALTSAGGITEDPGATVTAATLTGSAGGPAFLNGTANAIGIIGSFAANAGNFELSDTGSLSINGPVTATGAVSIGGAAGSTPDSITLAGGGRVVSEQVSLASGDGGITLDSGALLGEAGAVIALTSTGAIDESTAATVTAAELLGSAARFDLESPANSISTLGNVTAQTFALTDATDLLVSTTLDANSIALRAPQSQITLADGATIETGGVTHTRPGPVLVSEEPSNGAPGAFIEAANFTQVGMSNVTGVGGGPASLEISVTGHARFDPPLGLDAPTTWLILDLGNGTASGNVFVAGLNVIHGNSGSASLGGTIAGVDGRGAARLGFSQPTANAAYTFNGCEIGAMSCNAASFTQNTTSGFGAVIQLLTEQDLAVPALAAVSKTPMTLSAYPLKPSQGRALTDPDVVPPNVSNVDF